MVQVESGLDFVNGFGRHGQSSDMSVVPVVVIAADKVPGMSAGTNNIGSGSDGPLSSSSPSSSSPATNTLPNSFITAEQVLSFNEAEWQPPPNPNTAADLSNPLSNPLFLWKSTGTFNLVKSSNENVTLTGFEWYQRAGKGGELVLGTLPPCSTRSQGTSCLNFDAKSFSVFFHNDTIGDPKDGVYFMRLNWRTDNSDPTRSQGSTRSRAFGLYINQFQMPGIDSFINKTTDENERRQDPAFSQSQDSQSGGNSNSNPTAVGAVPSATGEAGAASSAGGGGLPVGAIAGIAVGCGVLGLALVAFLVWFLLRRRRADAAAGRDHVADAPYGAGPHHGGAAAAGVGAHEYMLDKESHHAALAESPQSPYADDEGGVLRGAASQQYPTAGAVAAPVPHHHQQQQQPQSSPYAHAADPVSYSPTSAPRASTPQGVSSAVAHLVEDGMTQEQIARLEEEERALDEAIERAGRR